ncbi:MAG: PD-(D/E)XK nuclease family protein [Candidatus Diapherotrites archaeon]|nr:PD-(D/E)XK nuclease family protein [Candidatus Diapherotrites archaeon]
MEFSIREAPIKSEKFNIWGKIDEIICSEKGVFIVDDKPGETPYLGYKLQTWGYCLAFLDKYDPNCKIYAVLRNSDSQNPFWSKEFTKEDAKKVIEAIERIRKLFSGKLDWTTTKFPNKCKSCSFARNCDKCLIKI